jgi:hypothetical protein
VEAKIKQTSNFPPRSPFLGYAYINPIEAGNTATEACGEGSELPQVPDFAFADEQISHAFEVGIDANDDVEGIGIFEKWS